MAEIKTYEQKENKSMNTFNCRLDKAEEKSK